MELYHYFSSVTFVVQSADQIVWRVDGPLEKHSVATMTAALALLLLPERNQINL